jgi:hypothetical protein
MGNFKKMIEARMAKTGESWQTARRAIRDQVAPKTERPPFEQPTYSGPAYMLEMIYEAAEDLFARRPETHRFAASVYSRKSIDVEVKPGRPVALIPEIDVTFTADGARWWFDGSIAFIVGELRDGNRPVSHDTFATESGRERLARIIVEQINQENPGFAEKLVHFKVKSGFQRANNLIALVSLALIDRQEHDFGALAIALQKADGQISIQTSRVALGLDDLDPRAARESIAAARELLAKVLAAAETPRQKRLAERVGGYERHWRSWEESLARIETRRNASAIRSYKA